MSVMGTLYSMFSLPQRKNSDAASGVAGTNIQCSELLWRDASGVLVSRRLESITKVRSGEKKKPARGIMSSLRDN